MMTVNEMLREAITTDSRKRKARHQTELEALGYKIIKDGSWFIRNTKTGRFIDLAYNDEYLRTSHRNIKFGHVYSYKQHKYVNKPLSVINLEGLLNKNTIENQNYFDCWTNVDKLRSALHDKKNHENNLKNAMAVYQNEIDRLTKEYQRKIEEAKRSYEWNVKYHTDGLARANKNIAEIMNKNIDN